MSQLFVSGGQSIGVSASAPVLPMSTQDWSPLGWTSWIALQSKGLFSSGSNGKEPTCQCRRYMRCEFNPRVRKIPGGGHSNPLQYSCLEKPMDRGAWQATVHSITKSQTKLKWLSTHATVFFKIYFYFASKRAYSIGPHIINHLI